jgi:hypothetical protein
MEQIIQELINSDKFVAWAADPSPTRDKFKRFEYKGLSFKNLVVDEKHFSPAQLAEAWGVSAETVRILFKNEPGVLRLPSHVTHGPKARVRSYVSLKIPQSIAERVHRRLSAVPQ